MGKNKPQIGFIYTKIPNEDFDHSILAFLKPYTKNLDKSHDPHETPGHETSYIDIQSLYKVRGQNRYSDDRFMRGFMTPKSIKKKKMSMILQHIYIYVR